MIDTALALILECRGSVHGLGWRAVLPQAALPLQFLDVILTWMPHELYIMSALWITNLSQITERCAT